MDVCHGYLARSLLVAVILGISGGASLAPPPVEHRRAAAIRTAADAPSDKISDSVADGISSAIDRAHKMDWAARYRTLGTNYFEFVAQAAPAAYRGEGAAQYYIGRALERCEETNVLYQDADDLDQAVAHLAMVPALRERERLELLDCRQFLSGTPFETLPARTGGYPAEYWKFRAIDSRYPAAMVSAALQSPTPSAVQTLADALATGDGEAMLLFGWTRTEAANAEEAAAILGAAWILAACNSDAASCKSVGDVPITHCDTEIGSRCPEHFSGIGDLSARLGAQDLKKAQQLATEIQADVRSHEPSRLMKYLVL